MALEKVSSSRLRVSADLVERLRLGAQGFVDLLHGIDGRIVALEKEIVRPAVGVGVHEDGAAGLAVASGAADLLVVAFEGAGQRRVDDRADIGFVDAHAEGDGGDDAIELAGLEVLLDGFADLRGKAGVIGGGWADLAQLRG